MKEFFVDIHCKIYTDTFDCEMTKTKTTGQKLYEWLIKRSGHINVADGETRNDLIDHNIWYLGCNEKFGIMQYENTSLKWGFVESSFGRVQAFIDMIYNDNHFSEDQYKHLCELIEEGRIFDNMYEITSYLIAKQSGEKYDFESERRF